MKPTGIVVAPGDAEAMARGIERLLFDDELRMKLGENAVADSRDRFDLQKQASEYLDWYAQVIGNYNSIRGQAIPARVAPQPAI
jgi:glycosyltransferase involved in cell wall biosynthesis